MVAFSAAMLVWMHRQTRAATERGLLDTARAVAVAVDREHSGTIAALKVLATSEHLRSGNLTAFHRVAREAVATQPSWQNVVLYTPAARPLVNTDRKSTRLNSSHGYISYAVFCLKKKKKKKTHKTYHEK